MKSITYLKENDIDVDAGIELLGDEEVYNSMLEEFQRNYPKKIYITFDMQNQNIMY